MDVTDKNVRHDLARHHLEWQRGCGQQAFHGAALVLTGDRQGGDHDHRHGEDDTHQARNDVVLRDPVGIVLEVNSQFDRSALGAEFLQRSRQVTVEGGPRDLVHDLHGRADRRRIGRIGLHEHGRSFPPHELAREVWRQD